MTTRELYLRAQIEFFIKIVYLVQAVFFEVTLIICLDIIEVQLDVLVSIWSRLLVNES